MYLSGKPYGDRWHIEIKQWIKWNASITLNISFIACD